MARIPTDQIDRIKQDVSLLHLVQNEGRKVVKQGKDYAVCCPFHDDKTPSCIISPKSNLFNCFGCGAAGSVIDWVMKTKNVAFREAVKLLDKNCDTPSLAAKPSVAVLAETLPLADLNTADSQTLLYRVIDFYHETLKQSDEAQSYLKSRGLDSSELITHFKLGYANRSLGLTLPEKSRKAGAEIRSHLQHVGLYRESGHEHFNGSLVVPVIDSHGKITEVYGRKLLDNLRKGTPKHLYLPGEHQGVFNVQGWTNTAGAGCTGAVNLAYKEVILCESLIDALTFWRWGFKNVTTSYGIQGFTDELLAAFKQSKIKRVLIAYDNDDGGNNAAEKLAELLINNGIDAYRVVFPKGMDANEYALKVTPADKSLALVIKKAQWLGEGEDPRLPESQSGAQEPIPLAANHPIQMPSVESKPDVEIKPTVDAEVNDNEVILHFDGRRYRVRGLKKTMSYEQLKINLSVSDKQDNVHIDQLDLYNAKARQHFIKQAAIELGVDDQVIKKDLGKVLLKLEALQGEQIKNVLEKPEDTVQLTDTEHEAALTLLKAPDLMQRVLDDFKCCGVVGEDINMLTAYLAACSRKLEKPLAIMVQSSSAAGKSSLMDAVLAFMPEEERIHYSAMTGQSLFYMGEQNLQYKILAIAEEEGASNTSYALKLLQSEGEVSIASTGKNPTTGNLETQEYKVTGPVMLFSTTTAIDIDEELMNRCLVLSVDESREQTEAIHAAQRKRRTLEGLKAAKEKKKRIALHQNAQRLLKPLAVMNPYADHLTFLSDKTRTRRDHEKYLGLIDVIALMHQYQREVKTESYDNEVIEYIEVTLEDIALANTLAHEVLGRTLDELPPQTRKLLNRIHAMVEENSYKEKISASAYRFSRKDVRDYSGWGNTQIRVHMDRLMEMEYVLAHRGQRGQSYEYELLYQGEGAEKDRFVMGLVDVEHLKNKNKNRGTTERTRGQAGELAGAKRPHNGGITGSKRPQENTKSPINTASNTITNKINGKTHKAAEKIENQSYRTHTSPLAAPAHTPQGGTEVTAPAALERPCSSAASSPSEVQ